MFTKRHSPRQPAVRTFVQDIALDVIRDASREKPADGVLREVLKGKRNLFPTDAAEVSRMVFSYFRWHGWLDETSGEAERIKLACQLDAKFRFKPESFFADELQSKAVPQWVAEEVNISEDWLRCLQSVPKLWLRARKGQNHKLINALGSAQSGPLSDAVLYEGETDLFKTPEFHAGEFEIQDIASQAVGLLCDPQPGETWWDACSGEGGKLMHLADLMENKGLIWASDRAEWRLQKLKRRAARAKVFNYRAAPWDGGPKLPTKAKFDGVLVDAPCSGVGTWQRNPHARWTTTPDDVKELAETQKRLLQHVAGSIKPNGKLIYAVCTLTRSETQGVVDDFCKTHPEFSPLDLPMHLIEKTKDRVLSNAVSTPTIWPQDLGGNGMFIAAWQRKA